MEENIKDFDRSIEKAMNEYSATPPFGMWNRIAGELDAVTPAAAVAATATATTAGSLLPKVGLGTLILAVAMESALLINYVTNRNIETAQENTPVVNTVIEQIPVQIIPEVKQEASLVKNPAVLEVAKNVVPFKKAARQVVAKNENKATEVINEPVKNEIGGNEVSIPQVGVSPTTGNDIAADSYYFPPVDINTAGEGEEVKTEVSTAPVAPKADNAIAEKKAKVSSSSNERKWRFHPTKRSKWRYGKLNRK